MAELIFKPLIGEKVVYATTKGNTRNWEKKWNMVPSNKGHEG
jgi:hypothetical protein